MMTRSRCRQPFPPLAFALLVCWASAAPADSPIWVAIYDHSDGSARGPRNLTACLSEEFGFRCVQLTPAEIRAGRLASFDVLIMPGGSGSKQAAMLEAEGREAIREFVRQGKGYVGICAGSYLASSDYDWSLHLLNARVVDRAHWARGTGQALLGLTEEGREFLEHDAGEVEVYYGQGPLLAPDTKAELPAFETLAEYRSEIAKKGAPEGVMIGTTAIARAPFGAGRVICYSPHCEVADGPHHLVRAGVRWASGREASADAVPAKSTLAP